MGEGLTDEKFIQRNLREARRAAEMKIWNYIFKTKMSFTLHSMDKYIGF